MRLQAFRYKAVNVCDVVHMPSICQCIVQGHVFIGTLDHTATLNKAKKEVYGHQKSFFLKVGLW